MYTLCITKTGMYVCYYTQATEKGCLSSNINNAINTSNFKHISDPWDEWLVGRTVLQTITFDSVEQFKLDYPEYFI